MTSVGADPSQLDDFVQELRTAFSRQDPGAEARGAAVVEARLVEASEADFGIEVRYHALPAGPVLRDTIPNVCAYMKGCGAETPDELAAFWIQDLDEQLLADDSP